MPHRRDPDPFWLAVAARVGADPATTLPDMTGEVIRDGANSTEVLISWSGRARIPLDEWEALLDEHHPRKAPRVDPADVVDRLRSAGVVDHKGPEDTDGDIMRRTARDLRGGYDLGGSNRRAAVARVLDVVADALDAQETIR